MDRIEDCISFLIGKAAQQVARHARDRLASFGVTPGQYAVLKVLDRSEGLSGAELGQRLQLDSASITGVVDRLAARGLIERRSDPEDRRIQRVHQTKEARALQAEMDQAMDLLNVEAERVLGEDREILLTRLKRLGAAKKWERDA